MIPTVLLLTALAAVPLIIVVLGMRHERRTARTPRWTVRAHALLGQPVLVTDDAFTGRIGAQDRMLLETYPLGSTVELTLTADDGATITERATVSAVKRSLRGGWPQARFGYHVYFARYDGSEFPVQVPVRRHRACAVLHLDDTGLVVEQPDGSSVREAWAALEFSNGPALKLRGPAIGLLDLERDQLGAEFPVVEELLVKYAVLRQMHF